MTPQRPSSLGADTKPLYTKFFGRIKIFVALLLLSCGTLQAKDLGTDITSAAFIGTPLSGSTAPLAKQVTFIFRSTFVGTVGTVAFTGGAGNDASLTVTAPAGDTLVAIPYTVTAGTLVIVRLQ